MTPSQIIAMVRDAAILGALGFILWYVHRADENAFKVDNLTAATKQLTANAATAARYSKEASDAQSQLAQQMAANAAAIGSQRAPVLLCPPSAGARAVSGAPSSAAGQLAGAGGAAAGARSDPQPGRDVRPEINAFEVKFEGALATCRSVLAQWPH